MFDVDGAGYLRLQDEDMKRTCIDCGEDKSADAFYRRSATAGGYQSRCKDCHNERRAEWRALNKGMVKDAHRRYEAKRPARSSEWAKANREWWAEYRDKNRARINAHHAKRRVRRAMPVWANTFFIQEAYELSRLRTQMTGIPWEVDHIVPLLGETVCGLHVHNNLQVITKLENLAKRHRVWPDMPDPAEMLGLS